MRRPRRKYEPTRSALFCIGNPDTTRGAYWKRAILRYLVSAQQPKKRSEAKLQSALYDAFYRVMMPQFGANAAECYQSRFYSYGLFGFLDEWIKRGFYETPEEMTELFLNMIKNGQ